MTQDSGTITHYDGHEITARPEDFPSGNTDTDKDNANTLALVSESLMPHVRDNLHLLDDEALVRMAEAGEKMEGESALLVIACHYEAVTRAKAKAEREGQPDSTAMSSVAKQFDKGIRTIYENTRLYETFLSCKPGAMLAGSDSTEGQKATIVHDAITVFGGDTGVKSILSAALIAPDPHKALGIMTEKRLADRSYSARDALADARTMKYLGRSEKGQVGAPGQESGGIGEGVEAEIAGDKPDVFTATVMSAVRKAHVRGCSLLVYWWEGVWKISDNLYSQRDGKAACVKVTKDGRVLSPLTRED